MLRVRLGIGCPAVAWSVFHIVAILAGTLAWYHIKLGRINYSGAVQISVLAIVAHQAWWFLGISRIPAVWSGFNEEFFLAGGSSLVHGVFAAISFLGR